MNAITLCIIIICDTLIRPSSAWLPGISILQFWWMLFWRIWEWAFTLSCTSPHWLSKKKQWYNNDMERGNIQFIKMHIHFFWSLRIGRQQWIINNLVSCRFDKNDHVYWSIPTVIVLTWAVAVNTVILTPVIMAFGWIEGLNWVVQFRARPHSPAPVYFIFPS